MLDRRAFELAADRCKERVALAPHIAEHADLDQLMRFERDIDFTQHGRRQPVRTDGDDGAQMVCLGAQRTALLGGDVLHPRSLSRAPRRKPGNRVAKADRLDLVWSIGVAMDDAMQVNMHEDEPLPPETLDAFEGRV
jgi:hypothetical protein